MKVYGCVFVLARDCHQQLTALLHLFVCFVGGSGTNRAQMTHCEPKLLHINTIKSRVALILILFLVHRDTAATL